MSTVRSEVRLTDRGRTSSQFSIHEDDQANVSTLKRQAVDNAHDSQDAPLKDAIGPLMTSKQVNAMPPLGATNKKQKIERSSSAVDNVMHHNSMDQLLAKLSQQQVLLERQKCALTTTDTTEGTSAHDMDDSSTASVPITPATDSFDIAPSTVYAESQPDEAIEMLRLKQELLAAKSKIARMDQELSQTRITKHTLDQAMGPMTETDFPFNKEDDVTEQTISKLQHALNASTRPQGARHDSWAGADDTRSDNSDALSTGAYNRTQGHGIWGNPANRVTPSLDQPYSRPQNWNQEPARTWFSRAPGAPGIPSQGLGIQQQQQQQQQQRAYSSQPFGAPGRPLNAVLTQFQPGPRRLNPQNNRITSAYDQRNGGWGAYPGSVSSVDGPSAQTAPHQSMGMFPGPVPYQPRPIGTPLSPTAAEFTTTHVPANPWNAQPPASPGQTYVSPMEPLNYRRLLDRTVTCNWKYIVDKIVCNNDQQASIFLQQKLKIGTADQKFEIVEAIVAQAYPLMVNRFGNFLVQRCFEHGTEEQIVAIANIIRGSTLNLSMDAFGCHVIQKAFDSVPENYKAIMVHELLRRIPETVIHRYACHVWQKLFELRWSDSPPQIMKYVNEALRGMWYEVALGETGSLVVQNIFENCLEEDKRPCIDEVLASIDTVAKGPFGNWCIQHICEHGMPADRGRAVDHVVCYATEYSMHQFASKVVEKCLKIGGTEFLGRYLDRVCEGRPDRPRIPLIDIASDQYGNYLIQYILTNANSQHREVVATHIRKHMVSLRGSKFGSRVGMLCCNPAFATRPGPGVGPPVNRFGNNNNNRFGGPYR
ncbi:MAG: hypothetical protein M1812_005024 [Candelaria pacifica]|nr:MAG: hypothetical protein M1812_005024 [Candelaria pacifica]